MSLPIAGAPREPTHVPLDPARLMRISTDCEDMLGELGAEALSPAVVEEVADETGARESHIYAAMTQLSEVPCEAGDDFRVELCIGGCQKYGSVEVLDRVLTVHGRRRHQGLPVFGVVTKACLDKCGIGPVVRFHTPDGAAGMTMATADRVEAAITEFLEAAK
jgi:NADH:ubiquinone oxidoreductase subunit E